MTTIDVDESLRIIEHGGLPKWIADHLRVYLESGGREGHLWDSTAAGGPGLLPCLVLTTTGRRSGTQRPLPLIYGTSGDAYVVIASKGGAPEHPGWFLNLLDNPAVDIQVGTERFAGRARVAEGHERERLWSEMAELYPPYRDYQEKTTREIPVVVIDRAPSP